MIKTVLITGATSGFGAAAVKRFAEAGWRAAMQASNEVRRDALSNVGGVRAMPAVRALAKKLGIDLARVNASSGDGSVSMQDVKAAAARGQGLRHRVLQTPGIGLDRLKPGIGQGLRQRAGLARAPQKKDARHG